MGDNIFFNAGKSSGQKQVKRKRHIFIYFLNKAMCVHMCVRACVCVSVCDSGKSDLAVM